MELREEVYHATIRRFNALLSTLRHAMICPVTSFEVDCRSPVITEVFCHFAGRARGEFDEIMAFLWIHGDVEGVLVILSLSHITQSVWLILTPPII
jgi:hypothetical protein